MPILAHPKAMKWDLFNYNVRKQMSLCSEMNPGIPIKVITVVTPLKEKKISKHSGMIKPIHEFEIIKRKKVTVQLPHKGEANKLKQYLSDNGKRFSSLNYRNELTYYDVLSSKVISEEEEFEGQLDADVVMYDKPWLPEDLIIDYTSRRNILFETISQQYVPKQVDGTTIIALRKHHLMVERIDELKDQVDSKMISYELEIKKLNNLLIDSKKINDDLSKNIDIMKIELEVAQKNRDIMIDNYKYQVDKLTSQIYKKDKDFQMMKEAFQHKLRQDKLEEEAIEQAKKERIELLRRAAKLEEVSKKSELLREKLKDIDKDDDGWWKLSL